MAFFELRTPRDLFAKAERELERLQREFSIDHLFNFFVTAYHIQDYVKEAASVHQHELEVFLADADMKDCPVAWSGTLRGAPLGALPLRGGDKWMLLSGDREVDVEWLAERVVEKWRKFIDQHAI